MLLGLLRPTSGAVSLLGAAMPDGRLSVLGRVGSLVEAPTVYSHLTGVENLEVSRRLLGVTRQAIFRALEVVGLSGAGSRLVREYSTGMRQRLGLALAILGEPELLILDEPTNGLDPRGIQEVRDLIRELPGRFGGTVFLSSHVLSEVEQVASHVGIIHHGRVVTQGALETLLGHGLLRVGVRNPARARVQLIDLGWSVRSGKSVRACEEDTLLIEVKSSGDAEMVNEILLRGGHRVFHLVYQRASLEHLFFEATLQPEEASA
jgi:ABC-2 type transport system ATP-binding protein